MECPACGYLMQPYEKDCPRCINRARQPPITSPVTPLPTVEPMPASAPPHRNSSLLRGLAVLFVAAVVVLCGCVWKWMIPVNVTVADLDADPIYYNGKRVHLKTYVVNENVHRLYCRIADDTSLYYKESNIAIEPILPGFDWQKQPYVDITGFYDAQQRVIHLSEGHVLTAQTWFPKPIAPWSTPTPAQAPPAHRVDRTLSPEQSRQAAEGNRIQLNSPSPPTYRYVPVPTR